MTIAMDIPGAEFRMRQAANTILFRPTNPQDGFPSENFHIYILSAFQ
jgi:hypothetical protein